MNKIKWKSLFLVIMFSASFLVLKAAPGEQFGNTVNVGGGAGYYSYANQTSPVIHADFEFGLLRNFTLGPSVSFFAYRNGYYVGNPVDGDRHYYYEAVVPVGVKGTYYFDELLQAGEQWDFYAATTVGYAFTKSRWDHGYDGDRDVFHGARPFIMDVHIGAEFHLNPKLGVYADLSTSCATIGFSFHLLK